MEELGFINPETGREEPFRSSEIRMCGVCFIPITEANDSGWEVFSSTAGLTVPTCVDCWDEIENGPVGVETIHPDSAEGMASS